MTIQWTILDPLAHDTAVYECSVEYTEAGHEQSMAGQQFLAADGKIMKYNGLSKLYDTAI